MLHVVELMEKLISEGKLKFKEEVAPVKVAYHDPCDMGRHMGIYEPPRNVLKALPGVELLEFPLNRDKAKCCGGGGGMKGFDNEMAGGHWIQAPAFRNRPRSRCNRVRMSSCKGSFNQAAARARKEKKPKIKVMDITELVAGRLA